MKHLKPTDLTAIRRLVREATGHRRFRVEIAEREGQAGPTFDSTPSADGRLGELFETHDAAEVRDLIERRDGLRLDLFIYGPEWGSSGWDLLTTLSVTLSDGSWTLAA